MPQDCTRQITPSIWVAVYYQNDLILNKCTMCYNIPELCKLFFYQYWWAKCVTELIFTWNVLKTTRRRAVLADFCASVTSSISKIIFITRNYRHHKQTQSLSQSNKSAFQIQGCTWLKMMCPLTKTPWFGLFFFSASITCSVILL